MYICRSLFAGETTTERDNSCYHSATGSLTGVDYLLIMYTETTFSVRGIQIKEQ